MKWLIVLEQERQPAGWEILETLRGLLCYHLHRSNIVIVFFYIWDPRRFTHFFYKKLDYRTDMSWKVPFFACLWTEMFLSSSLLLVKITNSGLKSVKLSLNGSKRLFFKNYNFINWSLITQFWNCNHRQNINIRL